MRRMEEGFMRLRQENGQWCTVRSAYSRCSKSSSSWKALFFSSTSFWTVWSFSSSSSFSPILEMSEEREWEERGWEREKRSKPHPWECPFPSKSILSPIGCFSWCFEDVACRFRSSTSSYQSMIKRIRGTSSSSIIDLASIVCSKISLRSFCFYHLEMSWNRRGKEREHTNKQTRKRPTGSERRVHLFHQSLQSLVLVLHPK